MGFTKCNAKRKCAQKGGHLPFIKGSEGLALNEYMSNIYDRNPKWLGLTDSGIPFIMNNLNF